MGNKKFTGEDIETAYHNGVEAGQEGCAGAKADYEYGLIQLAKRNEDFDNTVRQVAAQMASSADLTEESKEEHGSYTLTVQYKHTKYAGEDTDFTTSLLQELAEDEFRFVTDHFDVLSVQVTADSEAN